MFLAWFELNKVSDLAKSKTYVQIPEFFTWDSKQRQFKLRRKKSNTIGRINYVSRSCEDGYFARILLNHQKGPKCFEDLRTVKEVVYKTYKDACFALGLLDDDKEYIDDLISTNFWACGEYLRQLFCIMLQSYTLSEPEKVWEKTWHLLSEDIQSQRRKFFNRPGIYYNQSLYINLYYM